jgi:GT2 family glycosyltransferase
MKKACDQSERAATTSLCVTHASNPYDYNWRIGRPIGMNEEPTELFLCPNNPASIYGDATRALATSSGLNFAISALPEAAASQHLETIMRQHDTQATVVLLTTANGTPAMWSFDRDRLIEIGGWRRGEPDWLREAAERIVALGGTMVTEVVAEPNVEAIVRPALAPLRKQRREHQPLTSTAPRATVFVVLPGIDRAAVRSRFEKQYRTVIEADSLEDITALSSPATSDVAVLTTLPPDLLNGLPWDTSLSTLVPSPADRVLREALAADPTMRDRLSGDDADVAAELLRLTERHRVTECLGGSWLGPVDLTPAELAHVATTRLITLTWVTSGPADQADSLAQLARGLGTGWPTGPAAAITDDLPAISVAVAAAILDAEPYDRQLYEIACQRFEGQRTGLGLTLQQMTRRASDVERTAQALLPPSLTGTGVGRNNAASRHAASKHVSRARKIAARKLDARERISAVMASKGVDKVVGTRFAQRALLRAAPQRTIGLSLLAWNSRKASAEALRALIDEAALLTSIGHRVTVNVLDNGSTDGTSDELAKVLQASSIAFQVWNLPNNAGSSVGRNLLADAAIAGGAEYVWFNDADVVCPPGFVAAALDFMQRAEPLIGCIGSAFEQRNQSRSGRGTTRAVGHIDRRHTRLAEHQIPCQLGLFRTEIFLNGVRFETEGAFGQAGWGLEDTDFAFQMVANGYVSMLYDATVYTHARSGSSVTSLEASGMSVAASYNERLDILRRKWLATTPIGTRFLDHLIHRQYWDPRE